MTTTAARGPARRLDLTFGGRWPLVLGLAALAIPTMYSLADQTWSRDTGAQGPIILATGGWLLWRQWPELRREAKPGRASITALLLLISLAAYVFGRAYDFITLEAAGVYGAGFAMLYVNFGGRALVKVWFPLFYLAFAVPAPSYVIDHLTAPLKQFVSMVATNGLQSVGMPVSRQGVTIFIAQYQLLVEDACSGMNSLTGLIAISLLYIYLIRGSNILYSLILTFFVIPVAIIANIIRIIFIILITYYFGDAVGQSFIHYAAGLFLFATSLLFIFALDRGLYRAIGRLGSRP